MSEPEDHPDDDSHTITLQQDGVTVEKRLAPDEFDTPAVVFTIESDREAPAYVQITDPLPESIDPDDVGLHPEYDSEGWRRRGGDLQFEGRLDPGQKLETVYGLRVAEVERPSALLAEPRIDELVDADVVTDATTSEPEPGTAVTVDMGTDGGSGDGGSEDGGDEPDPADGEEGADAGTGNDADGDTEDDDEDGGDAGTEDGEDGAEDGGDADPAESPPALADEGSVAAALAAELEAGEVDDGTKATLSDHLEVRLSNSSDVRLDAVQARLSDLEAYTDALERIIDRVGTDQDALADLSEMRSDLDALERELDDATESLDDAVARTEDVESTTADLEATADDLAATVEDLDSEMESVRERLDGVEELPETVADVEEELAELRAEVTALREETEDELDGLREDVDELEAWRENLASSIAGAMGGDD